jgi:hypothetical protein
MTDQGRLMSAGKARWLLDGGIEELSEEERALLLAIVSLEVGSGRTLTEEESKALNGILARAGADGAEIAQAVKHMLEAKPNKDARLDWSELKGRLRRK